MQLGKGTPMKPLWQAAINKWRDQSGSAHVTFDEKGPACGARPFTLGGAYATLEETGSPTCGRCLRILNRKIGK